MKDEKMEQTRLDSRAEKVRLLSVIYKMIEYLRPKSILIYGRDKDGLIKVLKENYYYIRIYDCDPSVEECQNLPTDKVDLVVNTDVLSKTFDQISKISEKVIFYSHNAESNATLLNGELEKYFPSIKMLSDLNHLYSVSLTFDLPPEVENQCNDLLKGNLKYIDNLENLIELLQNNDEVIFMPGIRGGKSVVEWLECSNNLKNVDCFAADERTYYKSIDAFFEKDFPLIPVHCLLHYRESKTFIVAMNPINHPRVYNTMVKFGFKNVFFLGTNVYRQIVDEMKKIISSEQIQRRFMTHVVEKLGNLEADIHEQNELYAVNSSAFERYRNFFRGRKIVMVAGGPTVNYYEPVPDTIHIGLNFAWLNANIPFDFLFTTDKTGNAEEMSVRMEQGFDRIKNRVFIGRRLPHSKSSFFWNYPIDISLRKSNVSMFYTNTPVDPYFCREKFYQDICHHPLANFSNSVFNAIHFALFTYPAELYLVGCDVTHAGHFYDRKKDNSLQLNKLKVGYAKMKAFAEHHYPETKIFSINPVSLKGLFTDIYTDEYKKSLENK